MRAAAAWPRIIWPGCPACRVDLAIRAGVGGTGLAPVCRSAFQRDGLQQKLTEAGIGTLIHYPVPPHLSGAYADGKWKRGAFPIAEELAGTVLSLPMGPHLSKTQVDLVVGKARDSVQIFQ